MDKETAQRLCQLNNTFYQSQYESFAQTRTRPWQGWDSCLEHVKGLLPLEIADVSKSAEDQRVSVLDLACGNLRFEVFLEAHLPKATFAFYAVDNCDGLVSGEPQVEFQNLDIIEALRQSKSLVEQLTAPLCDLAVAFGFLHHIPQKEERKEVLQSLIKMTRPGGLVIVTFWQFMMDSDYAIKALAEHEQGMQELGFASLLEEGDILLGWKSTPGIYRYCHSFSKAEVDELAATVAGQAKVRDRFTADGRTNSFNTYLVLEVL